MTDAADNEIPVKLQGAGREIVGIMHPGRTPRAEAAVIFLNAGPQYRVGPHRLYVKAARRMAELGFTVFRLDLPGIGDSEGSLRVDTYDCFEVPDVLSAVEFALERTEANAVILLGLCAGARCAVKAAAEEARVRSVVLWSLPIVHDSSPIRDRGSAEMSGTAAKHILKGWLKKSLSPGAWMRRISSSGRSHSVREVFASLLPGGAKGQKPRDEQFFSALESLLLQGKAIVVYGERDAIPLREFQEQYEGNSSRPEYHFDFHVIPGADHTFSTRSAQVELINTTVDWLRKQYTRRLEE